MSTFIVEMIKKNTAGLELLLIWLVGSILLIGTWYYYDAQFKKINHSIEQLNKE